MTAAILSELRAEVEDRAIFWPDELRACSPEEIQMLEGKLRLKLPAAFTELLSWIGRGAGQFMRGTDWGFDAASSSEVQHDARALLEAAGHEAPADAFFIYFHQGYQCAFMRATEGDHPPVYTFQEGDERVGRVDRFADFLRAALDDYFEQATLWILTGDDPEGRPPVQPEHVRAYADWSPHTRADLRPAVLTLTNLERLDVRGKGLRTLPVEARRLQQLRIVHLHKNALEWFPEAFVGHPTIETLYLSENKIRRLPESFGSMPSLRELHLGGNPLQPRELERAARLLPQARLVLE